MAIKIDACVALHPGDRKEQQDRVALLPHPKNGNVALAVLADGMGGYSGGELAARQVIHTARDSLERYAPAAEAARDMLGASLSEAHVLIKASRFINEMDPRSTAVLLLLQPGQVTWAHCGDSRLYRFRGPACLSYTTDHSYVEQLLSRGAITAEQARVHPNRNLLVTSLGGDSEPRLAFGEASDLFDGDSFLLCSDGLWAYFEAEEMGAVIADHTAREAAQILIERARERANGDGDNLSLAIVRLVDARAA